MTATAWSNPVRLSDVVETPSTVIEWGGVRTEQYDFSNEYVSVTVNRLDDDTHWQLSIGSTGDDSARHAQEEVAHALIRAAQALLVLNKPRKSVSADESLSDEIRVLLADREWTFRQAASEFGIELGRFGNLISGQTRWTVTDILQIAEALSDDSEEEFDRLVQISKSGFKRDSELVSPEEIARRHPELDVEKLATLRKHRQGPRYYKPALREVLYRPSEVDRWLEEH